MNSREIEKQIQKNELAIEHSKRVQEQIEWTMRDSKRRTDRALAILRRAGYLRER
jgi:hypothetical protein